MRVNATFLRWTGYASEDLVGVKRFQDLLTAGGRIYHETHYAPLLRMQGSVREIAVDIVTADGRRLPVLVNSVLVTDDRRVSRGSCARRCSTRPSAGPTNASCSRRREAIARTSRCTLAAQPAWARRRRRRPRFEIAALYRPAEAQLEVGGDWYDTFELPDGKVGIVVGDVVGRGLPAAAAMGQLRSAVRALALTGLGPGGGHPPPRHVRRRRSRRRSTRRSRTPRSIRTPATVTFTAAGHLPPVLFSRRGCSWAAARRRSASQPRRCRAPRRRFTLAPATGFVLYTDGLVERRTREHRRSASSGWSPSLADRPDASPEDCAAATLEHGAAEDDVCVLVFRRTDA